MPTSNRNPRDVPALALRCDATPETGAGHLMRCLALAQAWADRGGRALFVGETTPDLAARTAAAGFSWQPRPATPCAAGDLGPLRAACRASGARRVVLDGYAFTAAHEDRLRQDGLHVLTLDDTAHRAHYACDILLNQNLGASELPYHTAPYTRKLLGPEYILLRSEFLAAPRPRHWRHGTPRRILLTFGASDPAGATAVCARLMTRLDLPLQVDLLVGPANPKRTQLAADWEQRENFSCIDDANLPARYRRADLVVTAAGSTCWELAYLGVPALTVVVAENQARVAQALDRMDIMPTLGHLACLDERAALARIRETLVTPGRLKALGQRAEERIDGHGAARIVDTLLEAKIP